jgi:formyl-CoA transferase
MTAKKASRSAMNANRPNDLPLSGIRVIDFTQVMLGPVCTQMLADYGADVIKIERKGSGDLSRSTFEPVAGHDNPVFCSLNRNKRSAALDLKDPEHLAAVRALIAAPTWSSTTSAPGSWSAWAWATTIAGA